MTERDLMGADIHVQPSEDFKSSSITKSQQPSKMYNPNQSTTNLKGTLLSQDMDVVNIPHRYIKDSELTQSLSTGKGCCLKSVVIIICVLYLTALALL